MGKITITLTNSLEQKLRDYVKTNYAGKKGALSIVVEKALELWFSQKK